MTHDFIPPVTCNADPLGPSLTEVYDGSKVIAFIPILNTLIRANNKISGICKRVASVKTPDEEYDFVVIGGGTGGSAVAGRLSEIPDWKVLLLEAGPDEPAGAEIPGFATRFIEYLATQTGPLSGTGTIQVVGMLASNATTPEYPDIEIFTISYMPTCATGQIGALESTGKSHSGSANPFELPLIWANYLGEPEDVDGIVQGIKLAFALLETKALRSYNFTLAAGSFEACSDLEFQSDEFWACAVRQENNCAYHQGGTCKMGPSSDPMAVVDPRLRVHGIKGLRVADNSIMPQGTYIGPQIPSCNTAAPAMMIGERAADFIKEVWPEDSLQWNIE